MNIENENRNNAVVFRNRGKIFEIEEKSCKHHIYLSLKDGIGCFDPSGGVLMADKALKCIQVTLY